MNCFRDLAGVKQLLSQEYAEEDAEDIVLKE